MVIIVTARACLMTMILSKAKTQKINKDVLTVYVRNHTRCHAKNKI